MAKFRMVHTEFWNDPRVVEEFTPEDKFFYLYLLTNSKTTQIGIYQITKKQIAFDMGYSMETVHALVDRFTNYHEIIAYNPDTRELAIKNWGKYNLNRGGKPVLDCVKSELKEVKDKELINFVGARIEKKEIKAIYDSYNDTLNDSVSDNGENFSDTKGIKVSYDTSDDTTTISGQEKEEEEEKEEEKEEQQQKEKQVSRSSQNPFTFYEQNFGMLAPFIAEDISMWIDDLNEELVIKALEIALENQKPWKYAKSILKAWLTKNVKTINDVKALEVEFQKQQGRKFGKPLNDDITPEWYEKQKEERKLEQKQEKSQEEMQKEAAEADRMLKEYLSKNA
ncbi:DnaD domain protein [Gracilibacillus oryzae]|uniref:DnaD domain protein n=1 Tax=Gracilibacillus oryzae TaxID=1672701 RepID=A0A7C8L1F9_9BACI|nr:DnaD domain protein [Gracilibacillus oryzae]KAB8126929.1 DnaD domain protein [Gracilibacillus oryzae]